jgi:hypothetical protein
MKRIIPAVCLAAVFAVGLSAQNPPQTPPQTPQTQPPAQEAKSPAKTVTVTGCLKAGETPESYLLSDLKFDNKDRPVGTSGTETPPVPPNASLKLIGGPAASNSVSMLVTPSKSRGPLPDQASS